MELGVDKTLASINSYMKPVLTHKRFAKLQ